MIVLSFMVLWISEWDQCQFEPNVTTSWILDEVVRLKNEVLLSSLTFQWH